MVWFGGLYGISTFVGYLMFFFFGGGLWHIKLCRLFKGLVWFGLLGLMVYQPL